MLCRWEVEEERVPMLSRGEEEEEEGVGAPSCSESDQEEEEVVLVPPTLRITIQS
jgi:hypothetical protein